MSTFLPHLDPDPEERQEELSKAQQEYQFNYDTYVSPLAVAKSVPRGQGFALGWLVKVAERALMILANYIDWEVDTKKKDELHKMEREFARDLATGSIRADKVLHYVLHALQSKVQEQARSLDDYADLFRVIGLPPISRDFQEDRVFAWMRVAGPNPMVIAKVTDHLPDNFPVTGQMYSAVMPGDTLDAAIGEGRLYLADYKALDDLTAGTVDELPKYLYAPLALFAVEKTTKDLLPVAIQVEQTPAPNNPIFTPNDSFNWLIAKTIVEMADGNYHETVSHLGRTHLFVEPFVVTTHRQLSSRHPLFILLTPHFQGTLAINNSAVESLIAPKGVVDQVMAPTIQDVWKVTVAGVESFPVDEVMLPNTFRQRGTENKDELPQYPYRDDSLMYWEAIHDWVEAYVRIYYPTDADLANDAEVQAWFRELVAEDGARVKGMHGDPQSVDYLIEVLTLVIYTGSVQHAAVNFPQYDLMSYVPNVPGAAYRARPEELGGGTNRQFLDTLPPLNEAMKQMNFLYLLGSVHYSTLGDYGLFHFRDRRVHKALKAFQHRLETIGDIIAVSNQNRRPYKFLIPSGVPQSINI